MISDMDKLTKLLGGGENLAASRKANLDPTTMMSSTLFHLSHHGGGKDGDKAVMVQFREMLAAIVPRKSDSEQERTTTATKLGSVFDEVSGNQNRPVRVGFISTLLTDHSIGRIMTPLVSRLCDIAKLTGAIEIYIIGSGYPEYTSESTDTVIRYLGDLIDGAHNFPEDKSVESLQTFVDGLDLDVAIYTDVGMDVVTFFMPQFVRAADVTISWWGHPVTTGLTDEIDYWFGLDTVEKEDAGFAQYSEQVGERSELLIRLVTVAGGDVGGEESTLQER